MSLPLRCFAELPSTSDYLIELVKHDAPAQAVLAYRQTAGRGSRGRGWSAPEGNLNLSILLRDVARPGDMALVAGLALQRAFASWLPEAQIKWPNDLILHDAKLGGILIDSQSNADGCLAWCVIGFGVNLLTAPHIPDRRTTSLAAYGISIGPDQAAAAIIEQLLRTEAENRIDPFAIRAAWLRAAHPIGTQLIVRQADRAITGSFDGLTDSGALRLQTTDGLEIFITGEVLGATSHSARGLHAAGG